MWHKGVPRHRRHRRENALVANSASSNLTLDHVAAQEFEFVVIVWRWIVAGKHSVRFSRYPPKPS
jgi:hypothetical protein